MGSRSTVSFRNWAANIVHGQALFTGRLWDVLSGNGEKDANIWLAGREASVFKAVQQKTENLQSARTNDRLIK